MENASKALIMAAGVLLAMLLASIFVYLYTAIGTSTSNIYSNLEAPEINEFNQKFLNYEGRGITSYENKGVHYMTIQDVMTVVNLAIDNNVTGKFPTQIEVWVKPQSGTSENWADKNSDEREKLMLDCSGKNFVCGFNTGSKASQEGVYINTDTRLVEAVYINGI